MNKDLESYAWELAGQCGCFEEMLDIMQMQTDEEISEDCREIWNEFWSKHQEGCLDCD